MPASSNSHSERATLALRTLAEKDPCFASLTLFCHHRDRDEELAPAWTDGKTVFYGKAFEDWKQPQQVAVCAHEIMHVAFGHIPRGKRLRQRFGHRYRPKLFNITTDAIINETLRESGYRVPREGVFLCELLQAVFGEKAASQDALSKWTAESLYVLIDACTDAIELSIAKQCSCTGGKSGTPQGAGDSEGGSVPDSDGGEDPGDSDASVQEAGDANDQICETCGQPKLLTAVSATYHYATSKGHQDDLDATAAAEPLSPEEEQAEAEWQERTQRAFAAGQAAGRGIGKLGHTLADLPKSTTPWETILRTTVRKAVSRKRMITYSKPTRRWLAMDADAIARGLRQPAFEPGLNSERSAPRVTVGVDVSGSISDVLLEKFAAEIVAIGKRTGAEIHVLVFDTRVLSHTKMEHGNWHNQITEVEFARGGGTDFHDVLQQADALKPSIIVVLTDLYGPMGEAPRSAPVLWACPNLDAPEPKFGKVLQLTS
ncbi:MAG: VWA-like domain-containing protein [Paracoccaceae bacterium]